MAVCERLSRRTTCFTGGSSQTTTSTSTQSGLREMAGHAEAQPLLDPPNPEVHLVQLAIHSVDVTHFLPLHRVRIANPYEQRSDFDSHCREILVGRYADRF